VDKRLAERITRKNMKMQPQWKGKREKCLEGEEASDKEFEEVLKKLHNGN
jgi:predicted transcriptional regulator